MEFVRNTNIFNNSSCLLNFKGKYGGKDADIIYLENSVVKKFKNGRENEFRTEKDVLELLTKEGYEHSPKIIKTGMEDGRFFIEMTNEGETLFEYLLKSTNNQINLAIEKIKEAIIELARLNIMHDDLTIENILVSADKNGNPDKVTLIDFSWIKKTTVNDPFELANKMISRKFLMQFIEQFVHK